VSEARTDRDGTPLEIGQLCLLLSSGTGRALLRVRLTGQLSPEQALASGLSDPSGHMVAEILEFLPDTYGWMWEGMEEIYPPARYLLVEQS
jgi:hypothetical protein